MKRTIEWKMVVIAIAMVLPTMVFAKKLPDDAQKARILNKTYRMQIPFIENRGQIEDKDVIFYAKTFGGTLFVGKDGTLTYSLPYEDKGGVIIKEILTDNRVDVKGLEPSPTKINYFKGKDQSKWQTNIPSYSSVSLGEIYKGIDLKLKAYGKNVEKLFTVLPGENPEVIRVKLQGAKGLKVNEKGELEVLTEHGPIKFTKPKAYQEINGKRVEVDVSYNLLNSELYANHSELSNPKSEIRNLKSAPGLPQSEIKSPSPLTYGFKVASYNKKYPLTIDPLLASTFIGGGSDEYGYSLALDGSGNVYVTGYARSGFPTTPGGYDQSHNGDFDVFVSKLDSSLSSLLASTFIGGGSGEFGYSLALDGGGNVYVTGGAYDDNYPTTPGAYDETYNGGSYDVFVSKLDSSLSSLLASTFIGGDNADIGRSLALDGSGNVYVTGSTSWSFSDYYPTTPGAYDESFNGNSDVFVSKLNNNLSSLLASTFIGGDNVDDGRSLALDGSGNVYVTGQAGDNYPSTPGAYDETYNGGSYDVFVSKFDSSLSSLLASTFIGGGSEVPYSLALDGSGDVYVTGSATSGYPTTPGAYDETNNGGSDVFVSKLDSSLSSLLASTFIGGR